MARIKEFNTTRFVFLILIRIFFVIPLQAVTIAASIFARRRTKIWRRQRTETVTFASSTTSYIIIAVTSLLNWRLRLG